MIQCTLYESFNMEIAINWPIFHLNSIGNGTSPDITCKLLTPPLGEQNQITCLLVRLDFVRVNWNFLISETGYCMWFLLGHRHLNLLSLLCLVNLCPQPHV